MKNKIVIILVVILLIVLTGGIILIFSNSDDKEKESYTTYEIGDYKIDLNDKYKFKDGKFENKIFLDSYIKTSKESFSTLISRSSSFTNMNSVELDSNLKEKDINSFQVFENIKEVKYTDVNKDYYLDIILVKIKNDQTFIFQVEIEKTEDNESLLKDLEYSISTLKEK